MQTLALIPARGGSKGIPGKNGRPFLGKPLLSWALDIGRQTCDKTYLSTEDATLARIGTMHGVTVIRRPPELATDESPMFPTVRHALRTVLPWKPDVVVLLEPTQPLRTVAQIKEAIAVLEEDVNGDVDSVVSVVPFPPQFSPDLAVCSHGPWIRRVNSRVTRRQEARPMWARDGTVYCSRARTIRSGTLYGTHCFPFFLDPDDSVSIDTEADWIKAEEVMRRRTHSTLMVSHG